MPRGAAPGRLVTRSLVASLEIFLGLVGAIVGARRLAGSLASPLPPAGLLLTGAVLAAWSIAVRTTCAERVAGAFASPLARALRAAPTAAAALVALAVCVRGTSAGGAIGLWGIFIAAETFSRLPLWKHLRAIRWPPNSISIRTARPQPAVTDQPAHGADRPPLPCDLGIGQEIGPEAGDETGDDAGADVMQRLLRRRDADGQDTIDGLVRVEFTAGERTAHGHVAFCPPFAARPACDAEQADGPPARIRVAQLLAHGVRFDVKLESPAEGATSVLVEFSARCGANRSAAHARSVIPTPNPKSKI